MTDESNTQNGGPDVNGTADNPERSQSANAQNSAPTQDSGSQNQERNAGLGSLAEDAAHPFDQTNGIIDGLEGDADDPEVVEERLNESEDSASPLDMGANRSGSGG
ncbi:hypothetical protein [Humibacter albus]|jgi:hypothetical protein|uniref:hypothetical protein n=1 Tax=Humibacter albus TaxID=427754 RepID=UPI0003B50F72|nr:hypothetical protein [Humibacter albus]